MQLRNGQFEIRNLSDYDNHKLVCFLGDTKSGLEGYIAVHRKNPACPSFGATRIWQYETLGDGLKDALRLSKMMSYKAALAGLPCGGAKAVIVDRGNSNGNRKKLLKAYAESVNFLSGNFVTGTDVGLTHEDLKLLREQSPNFVGMNDDAVYYTALGLYHSIQTCLMEVFDNEEIEGKSFAIQGLGKIGSELLKMVYPSAGKIYVSDIDTERIKEIQKDYPKVMPVSPEQIHRQQVDVYCPCALSHSLNSKTISELRCRIIAGGANNQLESEEIGVLLYKLGILYAPDYVVNAGGLISVFDEYQNKKHDPKRVTNAVLKIKDTLDDILIRSYKQHKATNVVANDMAEKIFNNYA